MINEIQPVIEEIEKFNNSKIWAKWGPEPEIWEDNKEQAAYVFIPNGIIEKNSKIREQVERLIDGKFSRESIYPGTHALNLKKITESGKSKEVIETLKLFSDLVFNNCIYKTNEGCSLFFDQENNKNAPCNKQMHIGALNVVSTNAVIAMFETIDGSARRLSKTAEQMYLGGRNEGFRYTRRPEYFNEHAQHILSTFIENNKEFELSAEQTEFKLSQENIDNLLKSIDQNDLNLLLSYLRDDDLESFKDLLLEVLQERLPMIQKIIFEEEKPNISETKKTFLMFQKKWRNK